MVPMVKPKNMAISGTENGFSTISCRINETRVRERDDRNTNDMLRGSAERRASQYMTCLNVPMLATLEMWAKKPYAP